MEVLTKRIRYSSRADVFSLWFLGCLHIGSASCDEVGIRETVKAIKDDPLALWVGLGDLGEFISRQDWRFRQYELATWLRGEPEDHKKDDLVTKEITVILDKLTPIADKCLGLIEGNHEDKLYVQFDRAVHSEICTRLNVLNLQDRALIRVIWNRVRAKGVASTLDIYCHHGHFAGRKSGSKINNLHDLLLSWNVDIAAVAHGHERAIAPPLVTVRLNQNGEPVNWRRYALMAGSFLKSNEVGITSYASRKGYRPNDVGPVRLFYQPDKNRLWGEL